MAVGSTKLINYDHLQSAITKTKTYVDNKCSEVETTCKSYTDAAKNDLTSSISTAKSEVLNTVSSTYVTKTTYDGDIPTMKTDITNVTNKANTNTTNITNLTNRVEPLEMPGFKYVQGSSGNVTLVWVE